MKATLPNTQRPRATVGFVLLLLSSSMQSGVSGQDVIALNRIPACQCQLVVRQVLTMGEESGVGMIDGEEMTVRFDSATQVYLAFQVGGHRITLFDASGLPIHTIDRKGAGPQELETIIDAQFVNSQILALDFTGPKLLLQDTEGHAISNARVDLRGGRFRVTATDRIVVGSMDRRPAYVGYPLHEVVFETGEVVQHFGSENGDYNGLEPFAGDVVLGWSLDTQNVWRGHRARFQMEEWTLGGNLVRTVMGAPSWFREVLVATSARNQPPASYIIEFGTDARDRLWIVTRVQDDDWQTVQRTGSEGLIFPKDVIDYWDTRIDVFDLRERVHLGSVTWDEALVGFFPVAGGFRVQKVLVDDRGVPRIAVFEIDVGSN